MPRNMAESLPLAVSCARGLNESFHTGGPAVNAREQDLAEAPDLRNTMAGWFFADSELHDARARRRMLNPSLDLSNPCNLNCPYCFIEDKQSSRKLRLPDELTLDEILDTISDFTRAGAKTVNIVGAGEPTIDSGFRRVVATIASHNMVPVLFTNGIQLAERFDLVDFLYDHNATLVLKLDSFNARIQDLLAGRKGYAEIRDAALQRLLNRGFASHSPTRLGLDTLVLAGNRDEIPLILRYCRQENAFPIVSDYIPTGRTEGGRFVGCASIAHLADDAREQVVAMLQPLTSKQRISLSSELRALDLREFGIRHSPSPAYYSGAPCTQLLGLYVDIQGTIWPCVARAQRVDGALKSAPLGSIRQGDVPSSVWRQHPYVASMLSAYDGRCRYKTLHDNFLATENTPEM